MGTEEHKLEKEPVLVMYNQATRFAWHFKDIEDLLETFKELKEIRFISLSNSSQSNYTSQQSREGFWGALFYIL